MVCNIRSVKSLRIADMLLVECPGRIFEVFEPGSDGDLDLYIDETFGSMIPVARVGEALEEHSSIRAVSTTNIIEVIAPPDIGNAAASPFSEFFDLNGMYFDFNDGFTLRTELPYFQLLTAQGVCID